ncbi:GNAT family N-acetyltransferase [Bifidobacterium leontopitheci]|uniref:GNAT family acetyltransferase n=1 Tax=Bifidobacterium leontopitheci TaxID=2650774 RepID=A0A6I1GEX3_9BIFI|nr:GNAT family N-acetyltransferase [Bifidobacterium leontopitheci]KAB7790174.1 GNAT family acetyltransferase [Bifidobacterium leontopitheci]
MVAHDSTTNATGPVTYRPMTWDDVDAIVREFDRTWGECSSAAGTPVSMRISRHFVLHYLQPTTRGEIAERDGRFMGVTLSRVVGQPVLFPQAATALADIDAELDRSELGAKTLAETNHWHALETRMEDEVGINDTAQAEIELFLVSSDARGHGVGGTLWRHAMRYFSQLGVSRYYLHTDSSCDVSFYDHKGLDRVAERFAADHPEDGDMDDIFIYAGEPRQSSVAQSDTAAAESPSNDLRPASTGREATQGEEATR